MRCRIGREREGPGLAWVPSVCQQNELLPRQGPGLRIIQEWLYFSAELTWLFLTGVTFDSSGSLVPEGQQWWDSAGDDLPLGLVDDRTSACSLAH